MSQTGDAADQVVQMATTMATETAKTAADLSIKGLTQILMMLIASGKNMGERKKHMIRDIVSKPHDVFLVPKERMREFAKRCKEYNVPFFVVRRNGQNKEPFLDVIVREMDRGTVNRITEQMGITLAFVERAREDMRNLHHRVDTPDTMPGMADTEERTFTVDDAELSQMLGGYGAGYANPMAAQMEMIAPSAPLFNSNGNLERGFNPTGFNPAGFEAVSVTSMIRMIKAEREAAIRLPAGEQALQLPNAQRTQLPPGRLPQLPAPKAPNIDLKGR